MVKKNKKQTVRYNLLALVRLSKVGMFTKVPPRPAGIFWGDKDGDGVYNGFDCQPNNRRMQGPQHNKRKQIDYEENMYEKEEKIREKIFKDEQKQLLRMEKLTGLKPSLLDDSFREKENRKRWNRNMNQRAIRRIKENGVPLTTAYNYAYDTSEEDIRIKEKEIMREKIKQKIKEEKEERRLNKMYKYDN